MIPNSKTKNMGGIISLHIQLASNIGAFVAFAGNCRITPTVPFHPIYYSYKSANIQTPPGEEGMFNISINFKSPNDRAELLASINPFINQKVVIIAKYSNNTEKVFGSKENPLILSFAPTTQGLPTDYNGIEFFATGLDFAPGRFLYQ
jgi:hypothetical protein